MKRWTQHLDDVNETYFEHMGNAMSFAGHMLTGAIACAIHAIAPGLFESTGSDRIKYLHERMVIMRRNPDNSAGSSDFKAGSNRLETAVSQSTK